MFNPIILLIFPIIFNQRGIYNRRYFENQNRYNTKNKSSANNKENDKSKNTKKSVEEERIAQELNNFKNIDIEERKKVIQDILPYLTGNDKNALLKLYDMFDIVYKLNRIKDNDYSKSDYKFIDDIPALKRAEEIIKQVFYNVSRNNNNYADNIIELLNGINSARSNLQYIKRKGVNDPNVLIESLKPLITGEEKNFEKLKKMLRFLNEED